MSPGNLPLAFEIVFDSLFVIFKNEPQKVYRVGGAAYNTLQVSTFFEVGSVGTYVANSPATSVTAADITTICSMDFHGLFLGVSGATKAIRLELDILPLGASNTQ